MERNKLQRFATWARRELISRVLRRCYELGLSNPREESAHAVSSELRELVRRRGLERVAEEAAYTWFNRFAALRYLEANGLLPGGLRVFTDEEGRFRPEVPAEALSEPYPEPERSILRHAAERGGETFYEAFLRAECARLRSMVPGLFGGEPWDELFPAGISYPDGVLGALVSEIPESRWREGVEILGWLYQYYNAELKEETFALLKKNVKISRERVPAATQLFTPEWIARWMAESSLGELWIEETGNEELAGALKYRMRAKQPESVRDELRKRREGRAPRRPEELRVIDPCAGSGNLLARAFDVLLRIYESAGYPKRTAVRSILEHNLHGLEIDPRAAQLASFCLLMKAAEHDRRVLSAGIVPRVYALFDVSELSEDERDAFCAGDPGLRRKLRSLLSRMKACKVAGALVEVHDAGYSALFERARELEEAGALASEEARGCARVVQAVRAGELLSRRFDCVIANPPYMGIAGMDPELAEYVRERFPEGKNDLYTCFIERCQRMTEKDGFLSMVAMQSWLYLSGYEALRTRIFREMGLISLLDLELMVMGIAFGTAAFSLRGEHVAGERASCARVELKDLKDGRPVAFPVPGNARAELSTESFARIPGTPAAYWVSERLSEAFARGIPMASLGDSKSGMQTGNNARFLRLWHEVPFREIRWDARPGEERPAGRWFPQPKGGPYRRWYGNVDYVVDYEENGRALREYPGTALLKNEAFYFREGACWSHTSSRAFSARYMAPGGIFNVEAPALFPFEPDDLEFILGFMNTKVCAALFGAISQTMHFMAGDMSKLPVIRPENEGRIRELVRENIALSKRDWDLRETSAEFSGHPLR